MRGPGDRAPWIRDVESRKIVEAVNADALERVFHSIRSSLERAIAEDVFLDDFPVAPQAQDQE